METLLSDVRYAVRDLLNARGFSVVVLATLALGIGAPTAMFTVINSLLLRPLPFAAQDRLVELGEFDIRHVSGEVDGNLSYPDFIDIRGRSTSLESAAAYHENELTATDFGDAVHVHGENVSANLFTLLRTNPAIGRSFLSEEDNPGRHVVILSDVFWRRQFRGDRGVIGRSIGLNGRAFTVVGVMPPGFQFPIRAESRDLWLTFSREAEPDTPGDRPITEQPGARYLQAVGRLKAGVSLAAHPRSSNSGRPFGPDSAVRTVLSSMDPDVSLYTRSMSDYVALDLSRARFQTVLLSCFAGISLLLTAMGLYGVISYSVTQRTHEIVVRMALGASRSQVLQMVMEQGMALTAAEITSGVVGAIVLARLISSRLYNTPPYEPLTYCSVCLLLALVAMLASYVPALRATRVGPNVALRVE